MSDLFTPHELRGARLGHIRRRWSTSAAASSRGDGGCGCGTAGTTNCNGICVATKNDPLNCGVCGMKCGTAQVCSNEAFAPLVVVFPFSDFDDAIRQVNDSSFGLQTGVFTNDLANSWKAFNELEVGGVIVNDIPTYRIDHMPYGGVKDSGLGREGLRWSIEDMTELRIMVLAQPQ